MFFFDEDGVAALVAAGWTDAVAPDPFVALAGGRSAFRVADLLALGALCDGLRGSVGGEDCKADYAAVVRAIMPGLAEGLSPRSGSSRHKA